MVPALIKAMKRWQLARILVFGLFWSAVSISSHAILCEQFVRQKTAVVFAPPWNSSVFWGLKGQRYSSGFKIRIREDRDLGDRLYGALTNPMSLHGQFLLGLGYKAIGGGRFKIPSVMKIIEAYHLMVDSAIAGGNMPHEARLQFVMPFRNQSTGEFIPIKWGERIPNSREWEAYERDLPSHVWELWLSQGMFVLTPQKGTGRNDYLLDHDLTHLMAFFHNPRILIEIQQRIKTRDAAGGGWSALTEYGFYFLPAARVEIARALLERFGLDLDQKSLFPYDQLGPLLTKMEGPQLNLFMGELLKRIDGYYRPLGALNYDEVFVSRRSAFSLSPSRVEISSAREALIYILRAWNLSFLEPARIVEMVFERDPLLTRMENSEPQLEIGETIFPFSQRFQN